MPKPSGNLPTWNTGLANQTEPNGAKKTLGWEVDEPVSSSFFNWLQFKYGEWVGYLDGLTGEALTWTAAHVFSESVRLARLVGSSTLLPALLTSDAPGSGGLRLLWQIKVSTSGGDTYARVFAGNASFTTGLIVTVNASWNGTQFAVDVAGQDAYRVDFGRGRADYYHLVAPSSPFDPVDWGDPTAHISKSAGFIGTGAGTVPGVNGVGDTGHGAEFTAGSGANKSGAKGTGGAGTSSAGLEGVAGAASLGVGVSGTASNATNLAGVFGNAAHADASGGYFAKTVGQGNDVAGAYGDGSLADAYGVIAKGDTGPTPTRSALRLVPQQSSPGGGQLGDLYVNSGDGKLYIHDGVSFVVVGSQA